MTKIYCKKCSGNQCYIQKEENIKWVNCPECQYKEKIYSYFNKKI